MSELQIKADMQFLAGRLPHRASNTESERAAAVYIRDRLSQYIPATLLDDFYSPDNVWYLFASYYVEFTVVSIIAIWLPLAALCYGAAVFVAYLAEFMGYRVMSRFVPQFETQNVVGQILAPAPRRQIVVMAHYDSGNDGPFSSADWAPWHHAGAILVALCMVTVLAMCAIEAAETLGDDFSLYITAVRWTAVATLLAAAATVACHHLLSELAVGANDNASGVAALLELAARLQAAPVEHADILLVATGSNQSWMHGARHLLTHHPFDKETSYFLNLDSVGHGTLAYATAIGMLPMTATSPELTAAAAKVATDFEAVPCKLRTARSDALIPLIHGYKAIEITAVSDSPPARDTYVALDCGVIDRAAGFVEAIIRNLAE